ncbi:MAG: DUF1727 domain-containing protein [Clostridia bacterium]|nr:DUF1727 domain-containing protein [Clostridia bacterium]
MKLALSVIVAKLLILIGKIMGTKSSSAPGRYAMKICPDMISRLSKQVKKEIIVVCGTNGKTTTNNIIYSLFDNVVCNNVGANMIDGVATAFAVKSNIFGRLKADYACIEVDELSTLKVFKQLKPDFLVVTNLFRDQLDRYGAIEITIDALKKAVDLLDDVTLVLNGDDPLVTSFGMETGKKCVFFGVNEKAGEPLNEVKDGKFCRVCGKELSYDFYHYGHLGSYKCENCDFKRPEIDYSARDVDMSHGLAFTVNDTKISVNYRGFYNIYNILAGFAIFDSLNLDTKLFQKMLANYKPQIGRMETFDIGIETVLNLAKNPAGFNQAISTVLSDKRKKNVIVAVNDKPSDGCDVSWLYDVDFEKLKDANVVRLSTSGIRHNDLAVRFKYADLGVAFDYEDIKEAIMSSIDNGAEVLYILVNYTVLFSTQNFLRGISK